MLKGESAKAARMSDSGGAAPPAAPRPEVDLTEADLNHASMPGVTGPAACAWDRFVAAAPGGDVVQTAAWGRSKEAMGFTAATAIVRDGGGGSDGGDGGTGGIVGGGMIVVRPLSSLKGLGAVGYVARGPLVADPEDRAMIARTLDEVERMARFLRVRHLVVQPPRGGDAIARMLDERGYQTGATNVAPACTLMVDLAPDIDTIFARMSTSQRRNLRRARRDGVEVHRGGRDDLAAFHALHAATAARQGFEPRSLAYLEAQWDALKPSGAVELFLAFAPGDRDIPPTGPFAGPFAGQWVTAFSDTVTGKIPGWNGEAPKLQPNLASLWRAIEWAKEEGYRWFDLGGIDLQHAEALRRGGVAQPGEGERSAAAFKARFGGEVVMMPPARQRTFNPILRPLVSFGLNRIAQNPRFRQFITRLRNG